MRFSVIPVSVLLIFTLSELIEAQVFINNYDTVYGFDPILYNGRMYTYAPPANTTGDPYLAGKDYIKGQVAIRSKVYSGLDLNYDIYNQQLLLRYFNADGATRIIEISKSWLEEFSLGQLDFEYNPDKKDQSRICQVIKSDFMKILYYWKKDLQLDNIFGTADYAFSAPIKERYIMINRVYKNYRNNKEFVDAFPATYQKRLSNYLRIKKIKVRKASDNCMHELIQFCNSLLTM
jgi:hypothetical protein